MAAYSERTDLGGGSSSAITDTVMSNIKETYDLEGMKEHLGSFNTLLTSYEEETGKIDKSVKGTICADGFKGEYAQRLHDTYDDLVGNFTGFVQNYEAWNDLVVIEDSLYGAFNEEAIGEYKDVGTGTTTPQTPKPTLPYKKASEYRSADGTPGGPKGVYYAAIK